MFLARKIARAKWDSTRNAERGLADGAISADAVTGDLRTQGNTLSFWRCSTETNSDIESVVLAIAAAGERLDRLDIVWLPDEVLRADGHTLKNSEGRTPIADLAKRHVDVCKIDYTRLGQIAHCVTAAIKDKRRRRFTVPVRR